MKNNDGVDPAIIKGIIYRVIKTYPRPEPSFTMKAIGEEVGLSRERVRQIIKAKGWRSDFLLAAKGRPCQTCHVRSHHLVAGWCHKCAYRPMADLLMFCGECQAAKPLRRYVFLADERHQQIPRGTMKARWFCSKPCQGRYLGRHYGIGTPANPLVPGQEGWPWPKPEPWRSGQCRRGHDITNPDNVSSAPSILLKNGKPSRYCKLCRRITTRQAYWLRKGMEVPAIKWTRVSKLR